MVQRTQSAHSARIFYGLGLCAALSFAAPASAADPVEYKAAVLRVDQPGPMPISRLDLPPADLGFAGGTLGTADNMTTGGFLNQSFVTEEVIASPETVEAELQKLLDAEIHYIVTLADAATTVKLADLTGDKALILNASAPDDRLRGEDCRANLLHIPPSDAMTADALAQYLVRKRWSRWFLIEGSHPEDKALADAFMAGTRDLGEVGLLARLRRSALEKCAVDSAKYPPLAAQKQIWH